VVLCPFSEFIVESKVLRRIFKPKRHKMREVFEETG
jgi:hypothetical protein